MLIYHARTDFNMNHLLMSSCIINCDVKDEKYIYSVLAAEY